MNCQDISAILDDRDIERLSPAELLAAKLHLADCHQCTKEWQAHGRLIASPVPAMPGHLGQRLRELVRAAAPARQPRRAGGRPTLVAGLMLLGAAAAALVGIEFFDDGELDDGATAGAPATSPAPTSELATATESTSPTAAQAAPEPTASSAQGSAVESASARGFTVAVSPLVHVTEHPGVVAGTEAIYLAMLDELRAIPGLTLIEPDSTIALEIGGPVWQPAIVAASSGSPPDAVTREEIATELDAAGNRIVFELEPVFSFPAADEIVSVIDVAIAGGVTKSVRIDVPTPFATDATGNDSGYDYLLNVTSFGIDDPATGTPGSFNFSITGSAAGGAGGIINFGVSASLYESHDPSQMAKQAVAQLRKLLFEPDASAVEALQATILDRTAPADARVRALSELRMIAMRSGTDGRVSEIVPAVIDLALNSTTAGQRAWIWELVRGSRDTRLVAPLVESLLYDADAMVRLEAASTLVTFPDDPTAIAALEQAGRFDASPDVGTFASWASMTESEQRNHVAAALLDTSLSDAERIAPLSFGARYPYGPGGSELVGGMDAGATAALVEIIGRTEDAAQRADLMQHLAGADRIGVVDFLVERLSADPSEMVRSFAVESLRARADDPRIRAALENASANDASPLVRGLATQALEPTTN
jgi:hypothetical protein